MSLIGKIYKSKTGKILRVADIDENNNAIFDDGSSVGANFLMNNKFFMEVPNSNNPLKENINTNNMSNPLKENINSNANNISDSIDPNEFLNRSTNAFFNAAQTITNEQLSRMGDAPVSNAPVVNQYGVNESNRNNQPVNYNQNNDVPVYQEDPQIEAEELARKYNIQNNFQQRNEEQARQQEEYRKALEEGRDPNARPQQPQLNENEQYANSHDHYQHQPSYEDPIISIFKKAKRNSKIEVDFNFKFKIPRVDFIEMMEDSYEVSIVDFLAEEFTNEIFKNPDFIKNKIKENIKSLLSIEEGEEMDEAVEEKEYMKDDYLVTDTEEDIEEGISEDVENINDEYLIASDDNYEEIDDKKDSRKAVPKKSEKEPSEVKVDEKNEE